MLFALQNYQYKPLKVKNIKKKENSNPYPNQNLNPLQSELENCLNTRCHMTWNTRAYAINEALPF